MLQLSILRHKAQQCPTPHLACKTASAAGNLSSKGIVEDLADGVNSLAGAVIGGGGIAVDTGTDTLGLVPNKCWYRGNKYDCGLSLTCMSQGKKAMDLCNGGYIWTCCVDRDQIDKVDPELGAVQDAQCGEVHSSSREAGESQARIVGGRNTYFGQHPWQVSTLESTLHRRSNNSS